jgi:hypothetical protein
MERKMVALTTITCLDEGGKRGKTQVIPRVIREISAM